jgi:predicted HTH transcriptional regulator
VEDDPRKWKKADLDELIKAERAESLTLDYKKSGALSKNPEARAELAKDVSALGNSAGGTLVYGMIESNRIATGFDEGVDPRDFSVEWIQNTAYGNVEPRIEGLDVHSHALERGRSATSRMYRRDERPTCMYRRSATASVLKA